MGLTTCLLAISHWLAFILCPGGGIGRRAGFRYLWPQGRGSSSLLLGTISIHPLRVRGLQVTKLISTELHSGDLPDGLDFGNSVAVDTETMGLNPHRDRLCVVQLSAEMAYAMSCIFPNRSTTRRT